MTTVLEIQRLKADGKRFAMLTAYDYTTARLLDEAGIPVLLVGDSLGMVMLGYETTLPVTLDDVIHHAKAVARGARDALLVGDMPFMSYHASLEQAITSAGRMLQEGGMHAVKLEGGGRVIEITQKLTQMGIPVMAHLGLTPQFVHQLGGFRVQGKTVDTARRILADAKELEQAGAFSVVLEGVPNDLARDISSALSIPTIGIGAGPHCDAQVLVVQDMLGLNRGKVPKFVKAYANLGEEIVRAARAYAEEVVSGAFPDEAHSYGASANGSRPAAEELRYGSQPQTETPARG